MEFIEKDIQELRLARIRLQELLNTPEIIKQLGVLYIEGVNISLEVSLNNFFAGVGYVHVPQIKVNASKSL